MARAGLYKGDVQKARDALLAQGKRDEARAAYLDAVTALDVASPTRVIVELKLANAGGTAPEAG